MMGGFVFEGFQEPDGFRFDYWIPVIYFERRLVLRALAALGAFFNAATAVLGFIRKRLWLFAENYLLINTSIECVR